MRILTEILYLFFYFVQILNETFYWLSLKTYAAISDIEPVETTIEATSETDPDVFENYITKHLNIDL